MTLQSGGIPFRVIIDGIPRDIKLDPQPMLDYIEQNKPALLDPAAKHSFQQGQTRTALKAAIKLMMTTYVNPIVKESGYPPLEISKHDDYITTAGLYIVGMILDFLAGLGGIVVEINGDDVTGIDWQRAETEAYSGKLA